MRASLHTGVLLAVSILNLHNDLSSPALARLIVLMRVACLCEGEDAIHMGGCFARL